MSNFAFYVQEHPLHSDAFRPVGCTLCFPDGPPATIPVMVSPRVPADRVVAVALRPERSDDSLGAALRAIRQRVVIDNDLPDSVPDGSPLDGGSMCGKCKGLRRLRLARRIGEADFGQSAICDACPEGRALLERQSSLPNGVDKLFAKCTFDTYPVTNRSRPGYAALLLWTTSVIDGKPRKPMFYLYGGFGVGKSGLGAAAANMWQEATGSSAIWITASELLERIRNGYHPDAEVRSDAIVERLKTVGFLVIDELGQQRVNGWVAEQLFNLINARHNGQLPTLITSNLDLDQLTDHLNVGSVVGMPQTGERIVWRIVESAIVQELDGHNLHNPEVRTRLGLDVEVRP